MKKFIVTLVVASLLAATVQAAPTYLVDIGTPASEAPYSITDWGPVEPTTHGGGWGSLATDPLSFDNLCRVVWQPNGAMFATVTFPRPIWYADIRHLDGINDDSFAVSVDGEPWGLYNDNSSQAEFWVMTRFKGAPGTTLVITSLANPLKPWWGQGTYGTLGIDRIEAYVPVPGALVLAGLGTAAVGWLRRRQAF